jgi:HD superfamily phosphohydrolase
MKFMAYREINDPVHGWNKIPKPIYNIIDTPLFQRLGYVSQLTLSNKVFPGANNTRKEHCLGVMNLTNMYTEHLNFDDYTKTCMSIAGLLHDIGHGPFSHSWDRSVYSHIYSEIEKGHDEHRKTIVDQKYTSVLSDINVDAYDIIDCWAENRVHKSILQGPLGTDRMDFVARDTFYAGTRRYGYYDINRIVGASSVILTPSGERLCYNEKIYSDMIQSLDTRNKMYEQVYYHKTSVAGQILLEQAIENCSDELKFVDRTVDLDKFQYLTDSILMEMIPISELARKLYTRDFPKLQDSQIIITNEFITPGIVSEDGSWTWTSLPLTNNYEIEFSKHDIYIDTKKQGPVKFSEYWRNQKECLNVNTWRFQRTYSSVKDGLT